MKFICKLCKEEQEIPHDNRWSGFKCIKCGQEYYYDNDNYFIGLTENQLNLLRKDNKIIKKEKENDQENRSI